MNKENKKRSVKIDEDTFKNGLVKNIIEIDTSEELPSMFMDVYKKEGYKIIELNYHDFKDLNHERRVHDVLEAVQPRINFYHHCFVRVTTGGTAPDADFFDFYSEVVGAIAKDIKTVTYGELSHTPSFLCM